MMTTEEQIGALSTAVLNTDKARRVGWARAYSAEQSRDDLARDANVLRSERDIMRRTASLLYGFIQVYAPRAVNRLVQQFKAMDAILDLTAAEAGRILGQQEIEQDTERCQREAEIRQAKRAAQNAYNKAFRAARRQERRKLMEEYGFPNEAAFLNYLEHYQGGQATQR